MVKKRQYGIKTTYKYIKNMDRLKIKPLVESFSKNDVFIEKKHYKPTLINENKISKLRFTLSNNVYYDNYK